MGHFSVLLLLWAVMAPLAVDSSSQSTRRHLDSFVRKHMYSEEANQHEQESVLTEHQRKVLRLVLRGINLDETMLGPLLDGQPLAGEPLFDLAALPEKLLTDYQLQSELRRLVEEYAARQPQFYEFEEDEEVYLDLYEDGEGKLPEGKGPEEVKPNQAESPSETTIKDREEYGDQVGGYEGCRRDYSTFIEPLTDRMLYDLHVEMCEEDPDFCNQTGDPHEPYRNMSSWAGTMLDALGKIPAAILDGQLHWSGAFAMCKEHEVAYAYYNHTYMEEGIYLEDREFHGEYCRVELSRFNATTNLVLAVGICIPDTCSREDVQRYVWDENIILRRLLQEGFGVNLTHVWCGHLLDGSSDPGYQTAVAIIIIILIIAIAATIYDVGFRRRVFKEYADYLRPSLAMYAGSKSSPVAAELEEEQQQQQQQQQQQNGVNGNAEGTKTTYRQVSFVSTISNDSNDGSEVWNGSRPRLSMQYSTSSQTALAGRSVSMYDLEYEPATWLDRLEVAFVGFSFYSNLARIFSTKTKKDHLECMNGLRFFSFCWLLLGHTYLFGPIYADCWVSMNIIRGVTNLSQQFTMQHIIGFHFQSDTFLVISGTLTTYWWMKHYAARGNKLGRGFIAYYFIHRWWRLMPAYMFGMMFLVNLYQYLGPHGVFIPKIVNDLDHCHQTWWRNFLFIHNFFYDDQCLSWTWYFAVVLQLHIVAIIVLIPLVKKPRIAYVLLVCLLLVQIGATAGIAANIYDDQGWIRNFSSWYFQILQAPWCRAGPYIVGLALGIVLHRTKCTFNLHWSLSLLGWLLALFVLFTVIYSQYDQFQEGGEVWSAAALIAYDTLARTAWGVGVAWIIFACSTGNGNVITMFLSLKIYQPFCRLIYPGYMLHSMMIFSYMYGQLAPFYIDEKNLNYAFLGNVVIVYLVSLFIALWFHYPIAIGLERALMCKTKLQAIMSGRHPNDDIIRYAEDRYLGHNQPWSLKGATQTDNRPPGDLGMYPPPGEQYPNSDGIEQATQANETYNEESMNGDTKEEVFEEVTSDGSKLERQISTTPL